jgi:hypothetical protein
MVMLQPLQCSVRGWVIISPTEVTKSSSPVSTVIDKKMECCANGKGIDGEYDA